MLCSLPELSIVMSLWWAETNDALLSPRVEYSHVFVVGPRQMMLCSLPELSIVMSLWWDRDK